MKDADDFVDDYCSASEIPMAGRAAHPGCDLEGIRRAVPGTGPALHATVGINDGNGLAVHFQNAVRTHHGAHGAPDGRRPRGARTG